MTMPGDFNPEAEARQEQREIDARSFELERELEGEQDPDAEKEGLLERIMDKVHPAPEVEG